MTTDLIALLLRESLPVRLALLDADPTGAGWYVGSYDTDIYASPDAYGRNELLHCIRGGSAWFPANPLAIVEHAARLKYGDDWRWATLETEKEVACVAYIMDCVGLLKASAFGACPHTAAVALLREVVGG